MDESVDALLDSALDDFDDDDEQDDGTAAPASRPNPAPLGSAEAPGSPTETGPIMEKLAESLNELELAGCKGPELSMLKDLIASLEGDSAGSSVAPGAGNEGGAALGPGDAQVDGDSAAAGAAGKAAPAQTAEAAAEVQEPLPGYMGAKPLSEVDFLGHKLVMPPKRAPRTDKKKASASASAAGDVSAFDTSMQQAFQQLNQDTESAMNDSSFNLEDLTAELAAGQTPDDIPDELKSMMDEVMGGLGGDGGEGVGMMEKMMEHLLSKELIYPSLVDIRTQYAKWLEENKGVASEEDYQASIAQDKIIKQILDTYDDASLDSGAQIKGVMALMEGMHEYGSPNPEIIKALGVDAGPDGMPHLGALFPGVPGAGGDKCSIM